MDQKNLEACQSKLRVSQDRYSLIYQWVLTRKIKLDEFTLLIEFLKDLPVNIPAPIPPARPSQDWLPEGMKESPFKDLKSVGK